MVYRILKVIMTAALRLFYRRIYVTGLENIAATGPAIIVPNHNSSLMDAALLGILIKRPLYFFARGDVFVNRFVSAILYRFHMLPVHPHDGGRNTLGDNAKSFSKAEEILLAGGIVIFFPEGSSHVDKQVLPLRKGVFRLAFKTSAAKDYQLNIPLIPAGITYSHPTKWRSEVMVHLGTPLQLADYMPRYAQNAAATLLQLSKDTYKSIEMLAPNVSDPKISELTIGCTEIAANEFYYRTYHWRQATKKRLEMEKSVYASLAQLNAHEREQLTALQERYFTLLERSALHDQTLSSRFRFVIRDYLSLVAGLPVFIAGFVTNFLPLCIAKRIVMRKVTRADFFSWILVTASTILYLLWTAAVLSIFAWWQPAYAIFVLPAMFFTGVFALVYKLRWKEFCQYRIFEKLKRKDPRTFEEMMTLRRKLLKAVEF